jgi:hypothetical protein
MHLLFTHNYITLHKAKVSLKWSDLVLTTPCRNASYLKEYEDKYEIFTKGS